MRKIKTPPIIWIILSLILMTVPLYVDFNVSNSPTFKSEQIVLSEGYLLMYIFLSVFTVLFFMLEVDHAFIKVNFLQTLKGSYFYRIIPNESSLVIYKNHLYTYKKINDYGLNVNMTTEEIKNVLVGAATKIDKSSYSYQLEELSTWKRFKD